MIAPGGLLRRGRRASVVLAIGVAAQLPQNARAQATSTPTTPSVGTSGGAATVTGTGAAQPSTQPGSTYVPTAAQLGAASATTPSGPIGGGNATESSAHPITGDEEDSFDLGPGARGGMGGGAIRGGDQGPIFITGSRIRSGGAPPDSHTVRRGDTLWGVCDQYFQNPYQWPRIWSYNPQIKNPNWIYPGDELRLKSAEGPGSPAGGSRPMPASDGNMTIVDRRRQVPNDTLFLRDQGWVRDPTDDTWGEITGAAADKMFLSDLDEVYLNLKKSHDVRIGQRLTIFRVRQTVAAGAIVQVLGTVRIDDWNERDRVARAQIVEALDVIERGAKIGPVTRSFEIVAPRRNEADMQAHVLASLHPNEFFGQNSVVFIDKGETAGLRQGNRLFIVRRGDAWRQTLLTADMSFRVSADDERPMPPMERTPGSNHDDRKYPDEVVAELRVVDVKKDTAACFVTQARVEIELRDLVVMRKGY